MLGTTTFMFVLGFITLVLQTVLGFQQQVLLSLTQADDVQLFNGVNVAIIVFSRLMVRRHDNPIPSAPLN